MADQISHKYKCIFIHIPKAGGTSIENTTIFDDQRERTGELVGGHLTAVDFREKYPHQFDAYYKFAVVRNPYDRLVSAFFYFAQYRGEQANNIEMKKRITEQYGGDFSQFCEGELTSGRADLFTHLRPQTDFLLDEQGTLLVDFVGKLECIQQDFKAICDQIGIDISLPHQNRSLRRDYSNYYTPTAQQLVAEIYRKELELFGYEFQRSRVRAVKQDVKAGYVWVRKLGGKVLRKFRQP
jgi:hypothetical protein